MHAKPPGPDMSSHTRRGPWLCRGFVADGGGVGGRHLGPQGRRGCQRGVPARRSLLLPCVCLHFLWNVARISLLTRISGCYFLSIRVLCLTSAHVCAGAFVHACASAPCLSLSAAL